MRSLRQYYPFIVITILLIACDTPESGLPDHPGYIDTIVAHHPIPSGDSAGFFKLLDSGYYSLNKPGAGDLWDKYHFSYLFYTSNRIDFDRALLYTDSMLYAIENEKTSPLYIDRYAKSLFYKGDALLSKKHYIEAFTWYYQAREVIEQMKDSCNLTQYSNRLAATSFRQGRFIDAANYFKLAIKDVEKCDRLPLDLAKEVQGNLDNVGVAYIRAGVIDSAEVYFTKALAYIKEEEPVFKADRHFMEVAQAVVYGNYADVAVRKNKTDSAEYFLKKSIKINELPENAPIDASLNRVKLAKIYLAKGRIAEAAKTLEKVTPAQRSSFAELNLNYLRLQSKLSAAKGNLADAYKYLAGYNEYHDSIAAQSGPVTSADMQQTIDNISRQYKLEILEKDNNRKSNILWLMILIAVMATVIILLVWVTYRRSKKNVLSLLKLNDAVTTKNQALLQTFTALEQSHASNTKLLKVVAHDLRGPLGAITSIAELYRDGHVPAEKHNETMDVIFKSGTKALALANDLMLDMQSLGRLTNLEPLNLSDQLRYCIELYDHRLKKKIKPSCLNPFRPL